MTEQEYIHIQNIQHARAAEWHVRQIVPEHSGIDADKWRELINWLYDVCQDGLRKVGLGI